MGKALERVEQVACLGLWEKMRIARLGGLGPVARGKCQSMKALLLSLPKNKSRLMRRKSEKWVPMGRHRHSTRGSSH